MQIEVISQLDDLAVCFPSAKINTIFDVGANVGQSTEQFLRKFPNALVHCFEPTPISYAELQQKFSNNPSVILNNIGLSDRGGQTTFTVNGASTMNRASLKNDGNTLVQLSTLDEYCLTNKIQSIDYLKIDTEGNELKILDGAKITLRNVKFLEAEASMNPHNKYHCPFPAILDLLTKHGFYLFGIYEQVREWSGGGVPIMRRANPVFVNASVIGKIPEGVVTE